MAFAFDKHLRQLDRQQRAWLCAARGNANLFSNATVTGLFWNPPGTVCL